jgi:hypothetical protein
MIRDLIDSGLSEITFRDEARERVADVLARAIEAAGESAVRAALEGRPPATATPASTPRTPAARAQARVRQPTPVPPKTADEENRPAKGEDDEA